MSEKIMSEKCLIELSLLDFEMWKITGDVMYLHRAVETADRLFHGGDEDEDEQ